MFLSLSSLFQLFIRYYYAALEIAKGIEFLHSQSIIHRDLKVLSYSFFK